MPVTSRRPGAACMTRSATFWNSPISRPATIRWPWRRWNCPTWPTLASDEHQGRAFSRRMRWRPASPSRAWSAPIPARCAGRCPIFMDNALTYTGEGGAVLVEVRAEEACGLLRVTRQRRRLFRRRSGQGRPGLPALRPARQRHRARAWAWPSPWNWPAGWAGRCSFARRRAGARRWSCACRGSALIKN